MDEITRVPQVVFWLHHLYLFYSADSDDILYLHELCEVPPMFTSIFFSSADSDDLLYLDELCEVPPCCSWEGCWQPNKRDAFKSFVKRRADSYTSQSSPGGILFGCSTPPRLSFPLQAPIIYQVLYYKHTTHVTIVVVALSTSLPSHAAWKGCQVARPGGLEGIANHQHTRTMSAFWSLLKPSCSVWSSSTVRSTPASASDTFSFGKDTFCNCEG